MTSLPTRTEELRGWGNQPVAECVTCRPESVAQVASALPAQGTMLARGLGRSYGDAALNPALTVRMERLDRMLAFDITNGILTAEAGVSLADILQMSVPRGWMLPVVPGTKYVTVGGAFACNVHGKNQFREGEFARHVLSATLRLADGTRAVCSAHENSELFWATAGGMGLTGIVEEVKLQLRRIDSCSLSAHTKKVFHLDAMIDCFEQSRADAEYMVGWIHHMATDDSLGRGVFERAVHISADDGGKRPKEFRLKQPFLNVPFTLPGFVLNRYSMGAYNWLRFIRYSDEWRQEIKSFDEFFHPLDGIGNWWKLYGKRGFFQYQCLIPESTEIRSQLAGILKLLQERKVFSTLAVLKYHGDHQGLLSFSKRGYSLALDFPNTRKARNAITDLNAHIAAIGGRVYLAKDALLAPELFEQMYAGELPKWRAAVGKIDPHHRFDSLLAARLRLKEEALHAS